MNADNSNGVEIAAVCDLQMNDDTRPSTRSVQRSGTQQRVHERGKAIPFVAPEELQKDILKQRTVILFIIVVGAASFTCLQRCDGRIPGRAMDNSSAPRSEALTLVTQWIDELVLPDKVVPLNPSS